MIKSAVGHIDIRMRYGVICGVKGGTVALLPGITRPTTASTITIKITVEPISRVFPSMKNELSGDFQKSLWSEGLRRKPQYLRFFRIISKIIIFSGVKSPDQYNGCDNSAGREG